MNTQDTQPRSREQFLQDATLAALQGITANVDFTTSTPKEVARKALADAKALTNLHFGREPKKAAPLTPFGVSEELAQSVQFDVESVVKEVIAARVSEAWYRQQLRDQFAGQAMQGMLADPNRRGARTEIAEKAVEYADTLYRVLYPEQTPNQ